MWQYDLPVCTQCQECVSAAKHQKLGHLLLGVCPARAAYLQVLVAGVQGPAAAGCGWPGS